MKSPMAPELNWQDFGGMLHCTYGGITYRIVTSIVSCYYHAYLQCACAGIQNPWTRLHEHTQHFSPGPHFSESAMTEPQARQKVVEEMKAYAAFLAGLPFVLHKGTAPLLPDTSN